MPTWLIFQNTEKGVYFTIFFKYFLFLILYLLFNMTKSLFQGLGSLCNCYWIIFRLICTLLQVYRIDFCCPLGSKYVLLTCKGCECRIQRCNIKLNQVVLIRYIWHCMPNKPECMVYKLPMHILCLNCNKHLWEIIAWYFKHLNPNSWKSLHTSA